MSGFGQSKCGKMKISCRNLLNAPPLFCLQSEPSQCKSSLYPFNLPIFQSNFNFLLGSEMVLPSTISITHKIFTFTLFSWNFNFTWTFHLPLSSIISLQKQQPLPVQVFTQKSLRFRFQMRNHTVARCFTLAKTKGCLFT